MNPPFHTGKETTSSLGQAFIDKAAKILKPGGDLYLVANNHLPYEFQLKHLFSSFELVKQENGFKVIHATK